MDWTGILGIIFGSGGFVTAFVSLFKARSSIKNEEVSRLVTTIEKIEERCNKLDADFTKYKDSAERMIQEGRERMRLLDRRNNIMTKALNSAWKCKKVDTPEECIALATMKRLCDKNKGVCEVDI